MAKKFSTLFSKMSSDAQAEVRARVNKALAEMPLQELRRARRLSQDELARTLGIAQPQISKIEGRTDLYVSTLRRYVEALGGNLEIVARFDDGVVKINLFGEIEPTLELNYVFAAGQLALDAPRTYQGSTSFAASLEAQPPVRISLAEEVTAVQPEILSIASVFAQGACAPGESSKTAADTQLALAA